MPLGRLVHDVLPRKIQQANWPSELEVARAGPPVHCDGLKRGNQFLRPMVDGDACIAIRARTLYHEPTRAFLKETSSGASVPGRRRRRR